MAFQKRIFRKKNLLVLMSMIACNAYAYSYTQPQVSQSQSTSQNQTQPPSSSTSQSNDGEWLNSFGIPKCNGNGILFAPPQPMPMPDTSLNAAESSSPQYCSIWDWLSQTKFTVF